MRTKIIEAKQELGGFMRTYPEKLIWDVGGIEPVRCEKLIESLEIQARTFEPTIVFGQQIDQMHRREDGVFVLTSKTGNRITHVPFFMRRSGNDTGAKAGH